MSPLGGSISPRVDPEHGPPHVSWLRCRGLIARGDPNRCRRGAPGAVERSEQDRETHLVPDTAEGDAAPGDDHQQQAPQQQQEPPGDEPKPPSKVVVPDSDPVAMQQQETPPSTMPGAPKIVFRTDGDTRLHIDIPSNHSRIKVYRIRLISGVPQQDTFETVLNQDPPSSHGNTRQNYRIRPASKADRVVAGATYRYIIDLPPHDISPGRRDARIDVTVDDDAAAPSAYPAAPEVAENVLNRVKITWPRVEGAAGYEVVRVKRSRGCCFLAEIKPFNVGQSDSPEFVDTGVEWGRDYFYYYRAVYKPADRRYYIGPGSHGTGRVTTAEEPHVTNRRIRRFASSGVGGSGTKVWKLEYRWNAPTGDAVGTLLGYTVEQWRNGSVTVTGHGPRTTKWIGHFSAAQGSAGAGFGTQYRIKVRYSTGDTPWSPYTISCTDQSECPETSYEEVGGYESS